MNGYDTLPVWVRQWGDLAGLDAARELLRRRPDLASLGKKVGGVRVFDAEAAEKIRQALAARRGLVGAK